MKRCDDCRYRNEPEYNKPCVVYREDCPLYQKGEDMTRDEAIKELSEMRTDAWTDSRQMEALEMAIKALEQEPSCPYYVIDEDGHGLCKNHRYMEDVLGEIRAEIEKPLRDERCYDTADAKAQYIALNWVCEIIDKHIKEIEGSDTE